VAIEQEHPVREAAVRVLGGTDPSLQRPPADPATLVLPAPLAAQVRRFDTVVDGWFERVRGNPAADRLFYGASAVGDFSLIWHIAGVAHALGGARQEREAVRLGASLGIESFLVNGVVKSFFRRTRPVRDHHTARKLRKPKSSSFPSGHATSGFMAASLLSQGRPVRSKVFWYSVATVVAASRVHVKIHHPSDVVAGAAVGVGLGAVAKRAWPVGNARTPRGY
jgi:undecaprenyl-diphosphatase